MFSKIDLIVADAFKNRALSPQYGACQVIVMHKGRVVFKKKYGRKYKYFDLASVTKAVFTTPVIINLIKKRKILLNDNVEKFIPEFKGKPIGKIKIRQLLDQTSGLVWWRPFYKRKKIKLISELAKEKVKKNAKSVYSDLNFIVLGLVIKSVVAMELDQVFKKQVARPLSLKNTGFNLKKKKSLFAPTERNYKGVVQGKVHDDNAFSFGGVSTHAGLFSNLEETAKMAKNLIKIDKKYTTRAVAKAKGDWALGFVIPSRPVSTGGKKISDQSFGFTGFTGTSVWIDRKRKAVVCILANRTYPSRKNTKYAQVRRDIHDAIWESLDEKR